MRLECIHCGKQYSLQDENAGAHFKCRRCGKISPVAVLSAAAIEGANTQHPPIDTAPRRSTAQRAIACATCGKQHLLPPNAAAGRYQCSACGAPMPAGRADAHSATADQVVWAEVISEPRPTRDMATEPATQGSSYDLFSETLPPTSGHVLSSSPAVVDESDSPYGLAPAIVEAVPAPRPLSTKAGSKPKRAATKKRKSDTVPLWVYLSAAPCAICVWLALSYRIPAIFAIVPIYGGVLSICGAVNDWEWFFRGRKARRWVDLLGRDGARAFYCVLGAVLILMGIAMTLAPRPVDDTRGRWSGQQHRSRQEDRPRRVRPTMPRP